MKKFYVGLTLLLFSAIIYSSSLISAAIYSQVLVQEGVGWNSDYGIFKTALMEIGSVPITIAIFSGILGIVLIIRSLKRKLT
ncbi:phosphatase [Paenibacillus donghaensis]|uniref:phosphatase n=1 Tax=Paenibacillus donghaensis TaxID=414771 RepID=UPI0018831B61|nr:phosphatase [Paenibacillus donghaensis]MBE9914759.1 phosphatase [Paenibacillus donghaensis]